LIHLVGDRFVVPTSFYHADYSATTRFLIIFGGGLRLYTIKTGNTLFIYGGDGD
jgi:hypothetical protein